MILCACGCGKKLSATKIKAGNRFLNRKHANRWKGIKRRKTENDLVFDVDYSLGKKYCIQYNNDDIRCVICYEQRLKNQKECGVWAEGE